MYIDNEKYSSIIELFVPLISIDEFFFFINCIVVSLDAAQIRKAKLLSIEN